MLALQNDAGMVVRVCDVGASLASIRVPDRHGESGEVLLGFDTREAYLDNPNYFGTTVGRYAGRIGQGRLRLDGGEFRLHPNLGDHHLHGGPSGFSHRPWATEGLVRTADGLPEVAFSLHSPAGDQGYPGNVDVSVTYRLEADNRLRILFRGSTDAPTHLSLTNHAYFNLAGRGEVGEHRLRLAARRYLPLGEGAIPTGELRAVDGTAWDFREGKALFRDRPSYDHCFLVDRWQTRANDPQECAWVVEPVTGRTLTVATTLPGIQFYTPDFEAGTSGRGPDGYHGREGFCLEAQFLPDSPNHPHFPSTRLDPGAEWEHETVFAFGTE